MTDSADISELAAALREVLKPRKGIPFPAVVLALSGQRVIPIDRSSASDQKLLARLTSAIASCADALVRSPIRRPRPNEVENDIEPRVMTALRNAGFRTDRPRSKSGRAQSSGYPDILFYDGEGRPCYLECKISGGGPLTTFRSFYVSPSDSFKVALDARHLLLCFVMTRTPIEGSPLSTFTPTGFKLVDLFRLNCDVKYEFNSDNRRLYDGGLVLTSGDCG
jgi:hypothetical protein